MVSFQAVKYLEGMLIQSQCQKKNDKITAELDDLKLDEDDKDKERPVGATGNQKENLDVIKPPDAPETAEDHDKSQNEEETENRDEQSGEDDEEGDGEDEEEISIDPRTYCKLGHFHLLLEDYAKGTLNIQFKENPPNNPVFSIIQPYLRTKSSTAFDRTTGRTPPSSSVSGWSIIITTPIDGKWILFMNSDG